MNLNLDSAKDTLCKNILIYGYCKFENKGCAFSHHKPSGKGNPNNSNTNNNNTNTSSNNTNNAAGTNNNINSNTLNNTANNIGNNSNVGQPPVSASSSSGYSGNSSPAEAKRKFNLNTPSFQPSNVQNITSKFAALSPKVKEIPVFVPSGGSGPVGSVGSGSVALGLTSSVGGAANTPNNGADANELLSQKKFNALTPSFMPAGFGSEYPSSPNTSGAGQPPNPYLTGNGHPASMAQSSGADVYYQQQAASYPLQYHLYAPAPPPRLTIPLPPHETNANLMFIPNDLRETLQKKNEATLQTLPRSNLPEHINIYHSLVPIDKSYDPKSKVWDVPSSLYKVFSSVDGNPYALRKIELNFPIINEAPFKTIKKWRSVKNANVTQLQEAFTSMAFGKSCLVVVYDYFPNSSTLIDHHKRIGTRTEPITEDLLWNYLVQLVNALMAIHAKGLAARSALDLTKIIVTNKNRIRLSNLAISDILNFEKDEEEISKSNRYFQGLQREDIKKLGRILLSLSTLTIPNTLRNNDTGELLRHLKTSSTISFSDEFIQVLTVLNEDTVEFDLDRFSQRYLTTRLFSTINNLEDSTDFMESQITTELENARLFRLLTKLNFIIDRPEAKDWTENSNKYIIKLFRDYIFFQHDEYGKPVVDLSRVLTNLNKLDAGIDEKFLLVSRDEKNCIIVSYKEIRDTIDSVFRNLTRD